MATDTRTKALCLQSLKSRIGEGDRAACYDFPPVPITIMNITSKWYTVIHFKSLSISVYPKKVHTVVHFSLDNGNLLCNTVSQ